MISIDRTAYPHFSKQLSDKELTACYTLNAKERAFVQRHTRRGRRCLALAVMLKTRQQLGYFVILTKIPSSIVSCLAQQLGLSDTAFSSNELCDKKAHHRYRTLCRHFLASTVFSKRDRQHIIASVHKAAHTMSDPADLINVAVEILNKANIELPAFSTLERLVGHERQVVHEVLYEKITATLSPHHCEALDKLLQVQTGDQITGFARMKQTSGPATLQHFRAWASRLASLDAVLDPKPFFQDIAYTKIRQFAAEASAYAIGDMRGIRNKKKRHTLLLSLLHKKQCSTRDEIIDMFLRRMKRVVHIAQEKLRSLQEKHREMEENLIGVLHQVLQCPCDNDDTDEALGRHTREVFDAQGGSEALSTQVRLISAYHHNNYLPLLWPAHATHRAVIFRVLDLIQVKSSTQDSSLLCALTFVCQHRKTRKADVPAVIDLHFASQRWQTFVHNKKTATFDRRALEVCVFIHLAEALQSGDIYVEDSGAYSDYREQLLPWEECLKRLPNYCQSLGLPNSGEGFVADLREQLTQVANNVDKNFPANSELRIDDDGVPHLKRQQSIPLPEGLDAFKKTIYERMPERHLLDILKHVQHWSHYTKHFGPPSGSSPKLSNPENDYLFTIFGYGCNLGASQTANHAPNNINRQTLRRINAQHTDAAKLEAALSDVIDEYARFELPKFWGKSNVAIADGTQMELRKNNLLGEQHIRYGGYGGIAYHHVSGEYIALFSHFIACGVWEAVYILDALLLNKSVYQPDTLHADTQGQSEPVFALAYLLGIKLFPRMRTWNKIAFYRPSNDVKYEHIDNLFTKTTDWKMIETHRQDMMQVVLSIQAGQALPSMLLCKLNSNNRQNKLYRAFRELGRVIRTLFLLRYISEADLRRTIRAETTKVESYNDFLDWITFGGQIIKSGDPVEQTKQIKYTNLVANSIMLHNVSDLTNTLVHMAAEGYTITQELVGFLSPYIRDHIRRFGWYDVDMDEYPPNLDPKSVPFSE